MPPGRAILPRMEYAARIAFVVELAEHLHAYGTTTQRLELAIVAVSQRLGLECEPWTNPTGMILSFGGAWGLSRFIFEDPFSPAWMPALVIAGGMLLLTMAIGFLTSRDVYRETPMAAIRES